MVNSSRNELLVMLATLYHIPEYHEKINLTKELAEQDLDFELIDGQLD